MLFAFLGSSREFVGQINRIPVWYHLLPSDFTIPEIQRLYEIILDKELGRANFYKKILNLEILESSGIKRKDTTYKPPVLYSFNQNYFKKTEEGFKNAF